MERIVDNSPQVCINGVIFVKAESFRSTGKDVRPGNIMPYVLTAFKPVMGGNRVIPIYLMDRVPVGYGGNQRRDNQS